MKALEERILKDGEIISSDILKVGSFLNQEIDTGLLIDMAKETKRLFDGIEVTKILTIEASGIAFATALALEFGCPLVFAKKGTSSNVSGELSSAKVHSFTKDTDYIVTINKSYISENDKVLLADDFLAKGEAFNGLIKLVEQSNATVSGLVAEVEKGYQGGGDALRKKGYKVESLAIIDSMDKGIINFRK